MKDDLLTDTSAETISLQVYAKEYNPFVTDNHGKEVAVTCRWDWQMEQSVKDNLLTDTAAERISLLVYAKEYNAFGTDNYGKDMAGTYNEQ